MIDLFFAFSVAVAIVAICSFVVLIVYLLIRLFVAAFGSTVALGLIVVTITLTLVIYVLI